MINMERAKQVALTGLVMTTCGFALWLHQGNAHAATVPSAAPTQTTAARKLASPRSWPRPSQLEPRQLQQHRS